MKINPIPLFAMASGVLIAVIVIGIIVENRGIEARKDAVMGRQFTLNGVIYTAIGGGFWGGIKCRSITGNDTDLALAAVENLLANPESK